MRLPPNMTWRSLYLYRFLFEVVFQIACISSFNKKSFRSDHSGVFGLHIPSSVRFPLPSFILITLLLNASAFLFFNRLANVSVVMPTF